LTLFFLPRARFERAALFFIISNSNVLYTELKKLKDTKEYFRIKWFLMVFNGKYDI